MSKPWEVAEKGVEKTEGELAGVHNIAGAELAARVLAGRNQQASDAIHALSEQVGELCRVGGLHRARRSRFNARYE